MQETTKPKSLLDPMDRVAEILFGLIMALTFTCSIGIANKNSTEIRQLLIGAISCNLAWGLVDASMFLIGVLAQKNRNKTIFDSVHDSPHSEKSRKHISESLPPVVASAMGIQGLDEIRNKIVGLPGSPQRVTLTIRDLRKAMALFLLIFVSTFPIVIPFFIIQDTRLALRISNLVAIAMMFLCGWSVAKYVGFSKWIMSVAMVGIGVLLVAITIVLGG